jgi:hypothetical protein
MRDLGIFARLVPIHHTAIECLRDSGYIRSLYDE